MGLEIPEKQYFKIKEVSDILDLKPYVLRYWESEFKLLKPTRTRTQQRLYHRKDLDLLMEIKNLLYGEGVTLAGAKKRLQMMKKSALSNKERTKKTKNMNPVPKLDPIAAKIEDAEEFINNPDYRQILLHIKTELQVLRSTLE